MAALKSSAGGRPGRRPKPTDLKIIAGSYRASVDGKLSQPVPMRWDPDSPPPAWISGKEYLDAWRFFIDMVKTLEVTTQADVAALCWAVDAFVTYHRARKIIDREGLYYEIETEAGQLMKRPHPAYTMLSDSWNRFMRSLVEFGMTPAARTRVQKVDDKTAADPFEEWEKGGKTAEGAS